MTTPPSTRSLSIPSPHAGLRLGLTHTPPTRALFPSPKPVLYVHGGTFPSALAVGFRFDGRAWRDDLCDAGFDVWTLDFLGFGRASDPYPEFDAPAEGREPLGRAEDASRQLEAAIRHILTDQDLDRISLVAHSWGSIVAGRLAGRAPELVDRLVLFGPIARREPQGERIRLPAWRLISLQDQWNRFTETVPPGEAPVLLKRHFDPWGEAYLDVDPESRTRSPAAVKVPGGAFQDIYDAWAGELAYDPGLVRAPVAIIRGEWDNLSTDADARWLFDAFKAAPMRRDIKIGKATHLVHLETGRAALYRETAAFLAGGDAVPA